jgi:hypothetical protein
MCSTDQFHRSLATLDGNRGRMKCLLRYRQLRKYPRASPADVQDHLLASPQSVLSVCSWLNPHHCLSRFFNLTQLSTWARELLDAYLALPDSLNMTDGV